MELGKVGVWWSAGWEVPGQPGLNVPAELETIGYTALWSTGGFRPGLSSRFERLLAGTSRMVVASAIVNIWLSPAADVAAAVDELGGDHPERFLLGLGVSHAPFNERYSQPVRAMAGYLDDLDAARPTVGKGRRVLAALGPKMLELAAARSLGAHPYFVPVEHTAFARKVMGDDALLAPELTVVLEEDAGRARQLGRKFTSGYLASLPNYVNNLRRFGYGDDDVAGGGSNRLIDALVIWGDTTTVAARIKEHLEAGADHVCLQLVADDDGFPLQGYRKLAASLV